MNREEIFLIYNYHFIINVKNSIRQSLIGFLLLTFEDLEGLNEEISLSVIKLS